MKLFIASFVLFSVAFATEIESADRMKNFCGSTCEFRFCKTNIDGNISPIGRRINIRRAGQRHPPFICNVQRTVGRVLRTGNPQFFDKDNGVWKPLQTLPVGENSLPSRFYSSRFSSILGQSVLVNKAIEKAQHPFLDKVCIRLPIERFEEIDSDGNVVGVISNSGNPNTDCVSFTSGSPKVAITLYWESSNDIDLLVTEPDNDTLRPSNPRSEAGGRHVTDAGAGPGECGAIVVGREIVSYSRTSSPELGTYTISAFNNRDCTENTRYELTVLVEGQPKLFKRGTITVRRRETQQLSLFQLTSDML